MMEAWTSPTWSLSLATRLGLLWFDVTRVWVGLSTPGVNNPQHRTTDTMKLKAMSHKFPCPCLHEKSFAATSAHN